MKEAKLYYYIISYLLAIVEDFHLVLEAVVGLGGEVGSPSAGG